MATTTSINNPIKQQEEHLKNRAMETASTIGDKARETAPSMADRAKDAAHNIGDKAREAVATIGNKAEDATHNVGKGMESLAGTLRDKMPQQGPLGAASSRVANSLESSGRYLEEEGLKGMAEDVTNLIRRNPIPAVLLGIGLGFLLARITSRS